MPSKGGADDERNTSYRENEAALENISYQPRDYKYE